MKAKPYHGIQICPCCEGVGSTSAWLGDVSDSLREDPEFADAYVAGAYDRPCEDCNGSGRQHVLKPGAPFAARREFVEQRRQKRALSWRTTCPIARAERAMGA